MKKKKEVTMWVIWDPNEQDIIMWSGSDVEWNSWSLVENQRDEPKEDLLKEGYRAVKGKFV